MIAKFLMTYEVEVDVGSLPPEAIAWAWMQADQQDVSYDLPCTPWEDGNPKLQNIEVVKED